MISIGVLVKFRVDSSVNSLKDLTWEYLGSYANRYGSVSQPTTLTFQFDYKK